MIRKVLSLSTAMFAAAAYSAPVEFDPGAGNVTNVTDFIDYRVEDGVSIESGTVNLLADMSAFSGTVAVNGGTLGVAHLRTAGRPSSIGMAESIVMAPGTVFSYIGDGANNITDASLSFDSAAPGDIFTVNAEGDFTLRGALSCPEACGRFVKTGPGTFTLGTPELSGATNHFARMEAATPYAITVNEGGLAIATGDDVTTVLGAGAEYDSSTKKWTYKGRMYIGSAGKAAHLDIMSGDNYIADRILLGKPGATTAINMYGGTLNQIGSETYIILGDLSTSEVNAGGDPGDSSVNVYGGSLRVGYMPLTMRRGTKGRVFVSGGTVQASFYGAHDNGGTSLDDPLTPVMEIDVCTNGLMIANFLQLARSGPSKATIRIFDGGTLRIGSQGFRATHECDGKMFLDGGNIVVETSAANSTLPVGGGMTFTLGEKPSTITAENSCDYVINGPVVSGVESGTDGGLQFIGGQGTFAFADAATYTGPTALGSGVSLRLTGDLTLAFLSALESDANLLYAVSGSTVPLLTVGGIDVPGITKVTFSAAPANGTYDIVSLPASSDVDVGRFVLAGASAAQRATFAVREEGGRKIVSVTLAARTAVTASWQNSEGGAWGTAANWNTAPASSPDTRVAFAAAASAQGASVTLDTPATVGGMTFSAAPGYSLSGSTLTLDNGGEEVAVSATAGENTLAMPITVARAATVDVASGATLNLAGTLSGGPVAFNQAEWPAKSGTVRLSGANTFTQPLKLRTGKITVTSIADAGVASAAGAGSVIDIGKGTFEYAGGVGSTDRTILLNPGDVYRLPGVGVAAGSTLTLTGPIISTVAGMHKCGEGTLILAGAMDYSFAKRSYNLTGAWGVYSAWGDAIASFGSLVVSGGRMEIAPAVKTVSVGDYLIVGAHTTDQPGAETGAEFVVNGGALTADMLHVGYDNGVLVPGGTEVLTNRLTVNGGSVTAREMYFGYQYYQNSRQHSEIVVNDGTFAVTEYARIGVTANSVDNISTARLVQNGGLIYLNGSVFIGAQSNPPVTTVEVNGGVYNVPQIRFSWGCYSGEPHKVVVREGGTVRIFGGINAGGGAHGTGSYVLFDGGTYQPQGSAALVESSAYIHLGEKGVLIDTSYIPGAKAAQMLAAADATYGGTWLTHPGVETDGGITVQGPAVADRAIMFASDTGYSFNGPVTVKAGGVALAKSTAFAGKNVTVKAGGAFGSFSPAADGTETTVSNLTLEDGATVVVSFSGAKNKGTLKRGMVRATSSLTQAGTVYVALTISSAYGYPLRAEAGTYPVVRGPTGSLDVSKFALSPRYAAGANVTFTLVHGDGYDEVQMTNPTLNTKVATVAMTDKTWTATTGGEWQEDSNWDAVPSDMNTDHIKLPATLSTPASISLGGERTLGALTSSADGEVSLTDGSLYLTRYFIDNYPVISNTCGTLVLPAMTGHPGVGGDYAIRLEPSVGATQVLSGTITSPTRIYGNSTAGAGGTIRIDHPITTMLETKSGTVEGAPANLGTDEFVLNRATFRFTEGGDSHATITGSKGLHIRTEDDVFSFGKISNDESSFIKTGKGTLYLMSDENVTLSSNAGVTNKLDDQTMAWQLPENGDMPDGYSEGYRIAHGNMAAGKLVLGLTGATTTFGGHMRLGCSIADFDENGDVLDSEIEVRGGKVVFLNDLYIARNAGFYRQYRDSAKRRNATFSVYGGEVTFGGMYMQYDSTGYFNGDAILNVYGGLVKSTGSYIYFNTHRTTQMTGNGQSHSYINIYGGMFTNTHFTAANEYNTGKKKYFGGLATTAIMKGDFDLNLFGGDFAWTAALVCEANSDAKVRLNFAGGRLTARYLRRHVNGGSYGLFWNGGTYQPTRNGSTLRGQVIDGGDEVVPIGYAWSYNTCSTNGANFQVPAGNTFTLDQALTHDADLGEAKDGGLAAIGEGTLVLGVANAFTGPVKAVAGTMKVAVDGAIPSGVDLVLDGGTLDLDSHNVTVGGVSGSGGWVRNGVATVTGRMALSGETGSWVGMESVAFAGAVFAPRYSYNATSQTWAGDYLRLGGSVTGTLTVDLGRTAENPLPKGFRLKVAELPASATCPKVLVVNWGETPKTSLRVTRTVAGDLAEIHVEVVGKGSVLTFR